MISKHQTGVAGKKTASQKSHDSSRHWSDAVCFCVGIIAMVVLLWIAVAY